MTEQVQQAYHKCDNPLCNYAPAFDKTEERNASDWAVELRLEHAKLSEGLVEWEEKIATSSKPSTLMIGNVSKFTRLLADNERKMLLAEAISEVVNSLEQGQITIHAPELGTLLQFTWGGFELFKALGPEIKGEPVRRKKKSA